jgi:hypothetical protein
MRSGYPLDTPADMPFGDPLGFPIPYRNHSLFARLKLLN